MDNIKTVPMATQTFFHIGNQKYTKNYGIPDNVVNPFDVDNWCSGQIQITKNCTINNSRLSARPVLVHLHPSRARSDTERLNQQDDWEYVRTFAADQHTTDDGSTPAANELLREYELLTGYCWDPRHEYLIPMPPIEDMFHMDVFNSLRNVNGLEQYSAMEIDHWIRHHNGEEIDVLPGLEEVAVPEGLEAPQGLIRQPIRINERYFGVTWEDPIYAFIPGCVKKERQMFPQQRTPVDDEAEGAGYAIGSHTILVKHGENQFRKTMDNIVHAVCPSGNEENLDERRRKAVNLLYDNASNENTVVSSQPFHDLLPTRSGEGIDIPEGDDENFGTRYRGFLYETDEGKFVVSPNDDLATIREQADQLFYPSIQQHPVKGMALGDETLLVDDMTLQGTVSVPASFEGAEEEQ